MLYAWEQYIFEWWQHSNKYINERGIKMRIPFLTAYREKKRTALREKMEHWHDKEHATRNKLIDAIEKITLANNDDLKDIREKHGKTLYKLHNGFKQLFMWRNEVNEDINDISVHLIRLTVAEELTKGIVTRLIRLQEEHQATHARKSEIGAALLNYLHVEMIPGEGSEPPFAQCKQGPTLKETPVSKLKLVADK